MTQKQKELLLKDLCSRLPYGVKCKLIYNNEAIKDEDATLFAVDKYGHFLFAEFGEDTREFVCKPYLFPLSSMSEEQKEFIKNQFCYDWDSDDPYSLWTYCIEIGAIDALIDVFNKYHIDYRGLIPMGLANDATGLNIY